MDILVTIFTYNRWEMLERQLQHLRSFKDYKIRILVLDDASRRNPAGLLGYADRWIRNKRNEGKKGFWRQWQKAMDYCKTYKADIYLFLADDHEDYDIDRMVRIHEEKKPGPYVFNSVFDGRTKNWSGIDAEVLNEDEMRVYFCDCGFFCPRSTLTELNFSIHPISPVWVEQNGYSSGVGRQLTRRLVSLQVPIFTPFKSLASHGDHDSVMHPELRKVQPLISR